MSKVQLLGCFAPPRRRLLADCSEAELFPTAVQAGFNNGSGV